MGQDRLIADTVHNKLLCIAAFYWPSDQRSLGRSLRFNRSRSRVGHRVRQRPAGGGVGYSRPAVWLTLVVSGGVSRPQCRRSPGAGAAAGGDTCGGLSAYQCRPRMPSRWLVVWGWRAWVGWSWSYGGVGVGVGGGDAAEQAQAFFGVAVWLGVV